MLSPKRVKFRKQQRGRMRGVATRGNTIAFGQFALQAQECGWDHLAPDRGQPSCHDPLRQAWRKNLDQDFS